MDLFFILPRDSFINVMWEILSILIETSTEMVVIYKYTNGIKS